MHSNGAAGKDNSANAFAIMPCEIAQDVPHSVKPILDTNADKNHCSSNSKLHALPKEGKLCRPQTKTAEESDLFHEMQSSVGHAFSRLLWTFITAIKWIPIHLVGQGLVYKILLVRYQQETCWHQLWWTV